MQRSDADHPASEHDRTAERHGRRGIPRASRRPVEGAGDAEADGDADRSEDHGQLGALERLWIGCGDALHALVTSAHALGLAHA